MMILSATSKRIYEQTAEIINRARSDYADDCAADVIDGLMNQFADYFESDNPGFDRTRFIKACCR